jgi:hypothetical protein
VFGAAHPETATLGIECDAGTFLKVLVEGGERLRSREVEPGGHPFPDVPVVRAGRVRPQALLSELQPFLDDSSARRPPRAPSS